MQDIISLIAELVWPILILIIFFTLRRAIFALVSSLRDRGLDIEVAGTKISIADATKQQQSLIADLQQKVATLIKNGSTAIPTVDSISENEVKKTRSILWVDDNPSNNLFLVDGFKTRGYLITSVLSTDAAIREVSRNKYDIIISDMGRLEEKGYNDSAGLELLDKLRQLKIGVPVIIYASEQAVSRSRVDALNLGANEVTASATTVIAAVESNLG